MFTDRWALTARTAMIVLIVGILVGCDTPEEREQKYMSRAVEFIEKGRTQKALVNLRNVLKINPRNAEALFMVGEIREDRENYRAAFQAYIAAANADPTLIVAHERLALLLLLSGDTEALQERLDTLSELDPSNVQGKALAAALMLREDNLEGAEELAREALALDPANVNATSALAGVFARRDDPAAAIAVIDERFATIGPDIPLALLKLQLTARTNDREALETAFAELIDLDPDNPGFRLALANFFQGQNELDRAESTLREALAVTKVDQASLQSALVVLVYRTKGLDAAAEEVKSLRAAGGGAEALEFVLADLMLREQRFADATTILTAVYDAEEAKREDDEAPLSQRGLDALTALATVELAQNQTDAALANVELVLAFDNRHRGANYLRGILALQQEDFAEAVRSGRATLERDPAWVPGLKLTAEGHLRQNQIDVASDILARVLAAAPNDIEAAEAQARILTQRGEVEPALELWDRIAQLSDDPTTAWQSKAQLAIQQRRWSLAESQINNLLTNEGTAASGNVLAGSLQIARGNFAESRDWFERAAQLNPEAGEPVLGIVQSFVAEGDLDGAVAYVEERLAAQPDDIFNLDLLAQLQVRAEDFAGAKGSYQRLLDLQPDWQNAYRALAALHEREGDVEAALAILDEAASRPEAGIDRQIDKAMLFQREDEWLEALAIYEKLLNQGVDAPLVTNNFSAITADYDYDNEQRLNRALRLVRSFETSQDPLQLNTLGWVLYRQGDPVQALNYLRRAVAIMPDEPQMRYHLGMAFHAVGNDAQAVSELTLATADPEASYHGLDEARLLLDQLKAKAAEAGAGDASR